MKKCYLIPVLLCMALSLFSQQAPQLHWKDIAQNPSLLTPAVALSLSQQGFDKDGFLPPVGLLSYNLTDSAHLSTWEHPVNAWELYEKSYYVNDCDLGFPISRLSKRKDNVSGDFKNYLKNEYAFFPNGAEKQNKESVWLPNSNEWLDTRYNSYIRPGELEASWVKFWNAFTEDLEGGNKTVHAFNAAEQLVRTDNYDLDLVTGDWVINTTKFLTYEDGKLVLEQTGSYDMGTWAPSSQVIYTYDSNGNNTVQTFETDWGQGWQQNQVYTNTYDNEHRLVERIIENSNNGSFGLSQKDVFTYHPNGQLDAQNSYTWLSTQQDWLWTLKVSYREDGQLINFISVYGYDEQMGGFLYGFRVDFEFDSNGLVTGYLIQDLIAPSLDDWQPTDKITISYDANDRQLMVLTQTWDEDDLVFTDVSRTDFFNTGCLYSGLANTAPATVDCSYANPIILGQPIDCPALAQPGEQTLRLYSMMGQQVHAQAFQSGGSIQPNQALAPGMYVLTITGSGGLSYRSKVMVP